MTKILGIKSSALERSVESELKWSITARGVIIRNIIVKTTCRTTKYPAYAGDAHFIHKEVITLRAKSVSMEYSFLDLTVSEGLLASSVLLMWPLLPQIAAASALC